MELNLCVSDEREHDDERVWRNLLFVVLMESGRSAQYQAIGETTGMVSG